MAKSRSTKSKKPSAKKPATKKPSAKKPAAKKPAAKKPAAKKPAKATKTTQAPAASSKGLLRGAALAEASLAARRKDDPEISGMSASELEAIDLGGKALSPSLKVWLAGDSEFFTLGQPQSFAELIAAEFPEMGDYFAELDKYFTEPVVLFEGWGADSRRMIYLGATDEHGEYPVFTLDTDDTPFVCLNGPVDVWLAQQAGALEEEETYGYLPKAYEPTRTALAKKCFGGYIAHLDGEFSKQLG